MAVKILVKLFTGEDPLSGNQIGILNIQAYMIGPGEHKKIGDEMAALAPGNGFKEIRYLHLGGNSLIAQVWGADEETVRRFEEAGWSWE
jgi:hypothetical protein